jgi:hypothetical protein
VAYIASASEMSAGHLHHLGEVPVRKIVGVVGLSLLTMLSVALVVVPQTASAAITPPGQPGAFTTSNLTPTSVYLTWGHSASGGLGIEGYRVYRQLSGGPQEMIYTTDALSYYQANNLRSGATYTFGATAIDVAGNESAMQTTTLTTPTSTDTTVPASPSSASLSVKAFSSTRLDLVWGSSTSTNVAYYEVYRGTTLIGTVDLPNAPRYSDNGLSPSTSYAYAVDAVSSTGVRSPLTPAKSGKTLATGTVQIARGPVVSDVTGTSAVISWWTNIATTGTLSVAGQIITDPAGVTQHHVVSVSGLTAATTNSYTVTGTVGTKSATLPGSITTAALPGQTFSFAAMGDYGGGGPGETQNANNINTAGTQFIQTLGDNIYPSAGLPDPNFTTTYSDFDTHFYKPLGADVATQAFFPANGNKDYYSGGQFWVNFPMPGTNHEWYSYNWGDAHILVIDSEEPMAPGSAQYQFVQNDLASNQSQKWRIIAIQRPPYSSTSANSSSTTAAQLVPLFQAYRVNLVLSGNSHNYERSYPLTNGTQDNANGIVYIVSGAGGSGFDSFTSSYPAPAWSAFRESTAFEFAKITVSPTSIVESAIESDTNTPLDGTTITALAPDTTAPTTPTGLLAANTTMSSVPLSWTANPVADGVTGYDIYRNGTKIGSTNSITTTFTDTSVTPGATYQYAIDATDGSGNVSPLGTPVPVTVPTATQAGLVQTAGSSTTTVTLPAASTQGNLLVLSASLYTGSTGTITAVSDGQNTWQKAGNYLVKGSNSDGELWYAPNAKPVSSVTVTTTSATVALELSEFSGVATTSPLDASSGTAATSKTPASGPATPSGANDLAIAFVAGHANTQAISATSPGYTLEPQQSTSGTNKVSVQTGYQVLSSNAAQNFTGTFPTAMYWSAGVALFKTSATGPPPPPPNDFSISASPTSGSVTAGNGTTASISAATTSGSAQTVALTASGAPANATVSFSPTSVTSGGTGSTMTVSTAADTPTGSFPITVTGTAASGAHTTTFTLTVTAAVANDFSIASSPTSGAVTVGGSTTPAISTTTTSGTAQSVALTSSGAPANTSVTFNPTSVTSGGSSTMTVTTAANTPTGSFPITVTGTGPSATHTATFTLTVNAAVANDFSIAAAPGSGSATAGGATSTSISTALTSGAAQTVALTSSGAPANTTVTFNPTSVTSGGTGSTMTVTTTATTPTGSFPITVTGTAPSGTHTATFTLTVTAASSGTTPALVQSTGAVETAATTALTSTFAAPTTSGDLLVLSASEYNGATNHITSVTDSAGNTWSRIGSYYSSGHNSNGELWYVADALPATTVTVHNGSAAFVSATVQEYSGIATTNALDTSAGAAAGTTSTSASSGSVTTSVATELVVGFVAGHANAEAMAVNGPGFTALTQQTTTGSIASVASGYQVLTAPGSATFTATFPTAMWWSAGVAVFRPGA